MPRCAVELMPLAPVMGWRSLNHVLRHLFPGMSKHLLILADLLHPVHPCFACPSVPALPSNALIPESPFIAVFLRSPHDVPVGELRTQASLCH